MCVGVNLTVNDRASHSWLRKDEVLGWEGHMWTYSNALLYVMVCKRTSSSVVKQMV